MKNIGQLCIAVLIVSGSVYAERTIWYVHPDSVLNTIQAGLDSCAAQDIVLVAPGTYYENIVWPNTQGIHLISEWGPDFTTIDGNDAGGVISCTTQVDTTTLIRGFTIQNGSGGGISCLRSSPSLADLNVKNNYASNFGGGIYMWMSNAQLSNLNVTENTAWDGGGIYLSHMSDVHISNTIIATNVSLKGGGIYCNANSNPYLENVIIDSNSSGDGGGIYCSQSSPILSNVKIIRNVVVAGGITQGTGAGIHCDDIAHPILRNVQISSNIAEGAGGGVLCRRYSAPILDSCNISYNVGEGIFSCWGSFPEIHYSYISDNTRYGICNMDSIYIINAEYNWWGDASGPYHPTLNPGGLGDTVSDFVDFDPWLSWPVGVEEQPIVDPVKAHENHTATIFRGPLQLPEDKKCKVFDITGRVVHPDRMQPGIYFIEIDGVETQKVVKVR